MSISISEPSRKRIAIQGVHGAFHEIAARHYNKDRQVEVVPAETFTELIDIIQNRSTDGGVMAIENTIAGSILQNYSLLNNSDLRIAGEVFLRIRQNLMALPGQQIRDLREVHSHPIAIQQCTDFFAGYPNIKLVETTDTALVARQIREGKIEGIGAIGSELAAELYDMEILAYSVESYKKNYTRFLALYHKDSDELRDQNNNPAFTFDKVSICFTTGHVVGDLYKVLGALANEKANMTKIQSVPIMDKPWEYMFFVDFVLDKGSDYQKTLAAIRPFTHEMKELGEYRSGYLVD